MVDVSGVAVFMLGWLLCVIGFAGHIADEGRL